MRKTVWTITALIAVFTLGAVAYLDSNRWVTASWEGTAINADGDPYYPADHVLYYKAVAQDPDLTPSEVDALVARNLEISMDEVAKLARAATQPSIETAFASNP